MEMTRMYDKNTTSQGLTQCQKIISENCTSAQQATMFIKALSDSSLPNALKNMAKLPLNDKIFAAHALLFGSLALNFGYNMIDLTASENDSNMELTVRKIIAFIKANFFDLSGSLTRSAIAETFKLILTNCFADGMYGIQNNKFAKDLVMGPIFDCFANGTNVQRQTACTVL